MCPKSRPRQNTIHSVDTQDRPITDPHGAPGCLKETPIVSYDNQTRIFSRKTQTFSVSRDDNIAVDSMRPPFSENTPVICCDSMNAAYYGESGSSDPNFQCVRAQKGTRRKDQADAMLRRVRDLRDLKSPCSPGTPHTIFPRDYIYYKGRRALGGASTLRPRKRARPATCVLNPPPRRRAHSAKSRGGGGGEVVTSLGRF